MREFKNGWNLEELGSFYIHLYGPEYENKPLKEGNGWTEDYGDNGGSGRGYGYRYGSIFGDSSILHSNRYTFELVQYWEDKI